ncbi:uncharacterized protein [Clytia hemisphaerica]
MGNKQERSKDLDEELKVIDGNNANSFDDNGPISYQDAVVMMSDYLKELTINDGKSEITNKLDNTVTQALSKAINFPEFVDFDEEDKSLNELIQSYAWIQPDDLKIQLDLQDKNTLSGLSDAVHSLAIMTTRDNNAFEMLKCLVNCCKHANYAIQKAGSGADDLLPTLIYVVLKSNPPRLYSHLKFVSNFLTTNDQIFTNSHRISHAVPRLFGTIIDCCFTNIQVAVATVRTMTPCEETREIRYGEQKMPDYLDSQDLRGSFSMYYEEDLKQQFKELEEGLNKLINVRKCIRDAHREDMIQIADKLDGNKKNAHIAKAIGLFVSIGGGIVSIVGFGLMFTTFGASAVLIPLGAALGGTGGLTASISTFVEYGIKRSTANDIKRMREEYETIVNDVFKSLQDIEKTIENVWKWYHYVGKTGKSVLVIVDVVVKLARLAVAIDNVSDVTATVFRTAGAAGRGLAIAGVVFSAILLPIDMVFFGISIKKLKDDEKSAQATSIRDWLDQDLPSSKEIEEIVGRLRTTLLKFTDDIRNGKDEQSLNEGEQKFINALEEIKLMIEQKIT